MEIVTAIVGMVFSGGPDAVSLFCLLVIIDLLLGRMRIVKVLDKKEERLDQRIND